MITVAVAARDEYHYSTGDIVWAKPFASHPFWPAQIADPRRATSYLEKRRKPHELLVYFFGSHDLYVVSLAGLHLMLFFSINLAPKNIHPFHGELHDRFVRTCTSRKLQDALQEAMAVFDDPESRFSCLEVCACTTIIYGSTDCLRMSPHALCVIRMVTWFCARACVVVHSMSSVSR